MFSGPDVLLANGFLGEPEGMGSYVAFRNKKSGVWGLESPATSAVPVSREH